MEKIKKALSADVGKVLKKDIFEHDKNHEDRLAILISLVPLMVLTLLTNFSAF